MHCATEGEREPLMAEAHPEHRQAAAVCLRAQAEVGRTSWMAWAWRDHNGIKVRQGSDQGSPARVPIVGYDDRWVETVLREHLCQVIGV